MVGLVAGYRRYGCLRLDGFRGSLARFPVELDGSLPVDCCSAGAPRANRYFVVEDYKVQLNAATASIPNSYLREG